MTVGKRKEHDTIKEQKGFPKDLTFSLPKINKRYSYSTMRVKPILILKKTSGRVKVTHSHAQSSVIHTSVAVSKN